MTSFWKLPDSPDAPEYAAVLKQAQSLPSQKAKALIRAVAEEDYWFFCRYCTTMRTHVIRDPAHPLVGTLWIDHPWVFARVREFQRSLEAREQNVFRNWARYHHKTTLLTCYPQLWLAAKSSLFTAVTLTFKIDKVGTAMFRGITDELLYNPTLNDLWPERFPAEKKLFPDFTQTTVTVPRAPGPREPTFSIHSLLNMPTSYHPRFIFVDDVVVAETVTTQEQMAAVSQALRDIVALRSDDTWVGFTGTIWDAHDPWITGCNDGYFTRRDHWTCYGRPEEMEEGKPCLFSEDMLEEWRRSMGEYVFSCQMLGVPVARYSRIFRDQWLLEYTNDPIAERLGKSVYIFCDFSGEGTDYHALWVIALGPDKKIYALDLWREQYGLTEAVELLFRLVKIWEPNAVFVEEFGAQAYEVLLRSEMESRSFRFNVQCLPKIKRPKPKRIEALAPPLERGELYFPIHGFGHGSRMDNRDTLTQFKEDEYRLWSLVKKSTLTDDMLDSLAWPFQPEVLPMLDFPQDYDPNDPFDPRNRSDVVTGPATGWGW